MNKRIIKELDELNKLYRIENYIYYNDSIKIYLNDNFVLKLILNNYPFSKPKVFIIYNNFQRPYTDFTHLKYPRFQKQLDCNKKVCFCGSTIMCHDWKPTTKIIDIINDVKNMRNLIRTYIYNSYIDSICNKYNIPEDISKLIYLEK